MARLEPHDVIFFATPADLRAWLEANHDTAPELWAGFRPKGSGVASITWPELVEEVLCYGWIDSVRMPVDGGSAIRLTPRRPRSIWSARNVGLIERLRAEGRMRPTGEAAFALRTAGKTAVYSFENEARFDEASAAAMAADPAVLAFFDAQPPGYRRSAVHWVMSAVRPDTRARRLDALVQGCLDGERLPQITGLPRAPKV